MARAGRKRKIGIQRESDGRVARKSAEQLAKEAKMTAIAYRQQVFGLSPAESEDQMAESYVGRLCLLGLKQKSDGLTRAQYAAALEFLAAHRANSIAIRAPKDASGMDFNRVQGSALAADNEYYYRRSTARWKAACEAVQERQNEIRGQGALYAALQYCVLQDLQVPHMLGDLRQALNALAKHFGLVENAKAA